MGLHAQLSGAEILEQVFLAREALAFEQASSAAASSAAAAATAAAGAPGADASPVSASSLLRLAPEALSTSLRNVVFMGMGEPLDNYEAVHEALRGMTHQVRWKDDNNNYPVYDAVVSRFD
jgi:adenine C2-methylase RlmN of 23S rRNA A2503 and tRNA A37